MLKTIDEQDLKNDIQESEFVLVGLGEEWAESAQKEMKLNKAYAHLAQLLKGKTYFVLTQNEDALLAQSPLIPFFTAAPNAKHISEEQKDSDWQSYLNWLSGTLGHRLLVLELGVGFQMPQLIRWPFEKCVQMNTKAKLIRIHHMLPMLPEGLGDRALAVQADSMQLLSEMTGGSETDE